MQLRNINTNKDYNGISFCRSHIASQGWRFDARMWTNDMQKFKFMKMELGYANDAHAFNSLFIFHPFVRSPIQFTRCLIHKCNTPSKHLAAAHMCRMPKKKGLKLAFHFNRVYVIFVDRFHQNRIIRKSLRRLFVSAHVCVWESVLLSFYSFHEFYSTRFAWEQN